MLCLKCKFFKIKQDPIIDSDGIFLYEGVAHCKKNDLYIDFFDKRNLKKLKCIDDAENLKNRIKKLGLTQNEIAKTICYTTARVNQVLNKKDVSRGTLNNKKDVSRETSDGKILEKIRTVIYDGNTVKSMLSNIHRKKEETNLKKSNTLKEAWNLAKTNKNKL